MDFVKRTKNQMMRILCTCTKVAVIHSHLGLGAKKAKLAMHSGWEG